MKTTLLFPRSMRSPMPHHQLHVELRGDNNASQSWLVVVGAHHFGADNNDPLFQAVQGVAWAGVLLVEADPHIARQMADRVAVHSPVPLARTVRIANLGVCPPKWVGRRLFHKLGNTSGLAYWATQIGSFRRGHVEKHLVGQYGNILRGRGSNLSNHELRARIQSIPVECMLLTDVLNRHSVLPEHVAVLLVDTEALDCAIITSLPQNTSLWPSLIVYEWKHCASKAEQESALHSMQSRGYRVLGVSPENVFAYTP